MGRRPSRGWADELEPGTDAEAEPAAPRAAVAWPPWLEGLFHDHLKQAVVTEGRFQGDRARLQIRGTDSDDRKVRGTIELRKVSGCWRVTTEALFFDP
jgi:hypothetical protein